MDIRNMLLSKNGKDMDIIIFYEFHWLFHFSKHFNYSLKFNEI